MIYKLEKLTDQQFEVKLLVFQPSVQNWNSLRSPHAFRIPVYETPSLSLTQFQDATHGMGMDIFSSPWVEGSPSALKQNVNTNSNKLPPH